MTPELTASRREAEFSRITVWYLPRSSGVRLGVTVTRVQNVIHWKEGVRLQLKAQLSEASPAPEIPEGRAGPEGRRLMEIITRTPEDPPA